MVNKQACEHDTLFPSLPICAYPGLTQKCILAMNVSACTSLSACSSGCRYVQVSQCPGVAFNWNS